MKISDPPYVIVCLGRLKRIGVHNYGTKRKYILGSFRDQKKVVQRGLGSSDGGEGEREGGKRWCISFGLAVAGRESRMNGEV